MGQRPVMTPARANVVSSFTIIKGAMISETYDTMARWDLGLSKKENLDRLRRENFIGAPSVTWLRDVAKVLNRRFEPGGQDRALVILAQGGCPIDEWKPILLWHLTRDEFLLRDFLVMKTGRSSTRTGRASGTRMPEGWELAVSYMLPGEDAQLGSSAS